MRDLFYIILVTVLLCIAVAWFIPKPASQDVCDAACIRRHFQ